MLVSCDSQHHLLNYQLVGRCFSNFQNSNPTKAQQKLSPHSYRRKKIVASSKSGEFKWGKNFKVLPRLHLAHTHIRSAMSEALALMC